MAKPDELKAKFAEFRDGFEALRSEVAKVIVGRSDIVEGPLTALIAGGHLLFEGVPGLGKTLLVRTLSDALQMKFWRIQFKPDLMPEDLIGTNVAVESPEVGRNFDFQASPGAREHRPRRRDQPRHAEDGVGLGRSHLGDVGHGRRQDLSTWPDVLRARDAEPA